MLFHVFHSYTRNSFELQHSRKQIPQWSIANTIKIRTSSSIYLQQHIITLMHFEVTDIKGMSLHGHKSCYNCKTPYVYTIVYIRHINHFWCHKTRRSASLYYWLFVAASEMSQTEVSKFIVNSQKVTSFSMQEDVCHFDVSVNYFVPF